MSHGAWLKRYNILTAAAFVVEPLVGHFFNRLVAAGDAVPALTKALEDQNVGVRGTAAHALKEINNTEPTMR